MNPTNQKSVNTGDSGLQLSQAHPHTISRMFGEYLLRSDFVGADISSTLMMGWTRARRYANHRDGKKYDDNRRVKPQEEDHWTCDKAESARIFKEAYDEARKNEDYQRMYKAWRASE